MFSAMGAIEYANKHLNKTGSEQGVIDCDAFSFGCDGGWPSRAFEYARDFGISDGKEYKYTASRDECKTIEYPSVMKINETCEEFLNGDEKALKEIVATRPVTVAYSATIDFMYYRKGIFSDPTCGQLNHALVRFSFFLIFSYRILNHRS